LESGCNSEAAGVISSSAAPQSPVHFHEPVTVAFDQSHVGVVQQNFVHLRGMSECGPTVAHV
jgi:hypothetical protein